MYVLRHFLANYIWFKVITIFKQIDIFTNKDFFLRNVYDIESKFLESAQIEPRKKKAGKNSRGKTSMEKRPKKKKDWWKWMLKENSVNIEITDTNIYEIFFKLNLKLKLKLHQKIALSN